MKCSKCGNEIKTEEQFCSKCGNRINGKKKLPTWVTILGRYYNCNNIDTSRKCNCR